jgi:hypothetical protein
MNIKLPDNLGVKEVLQFIDAKADEQARIDIAPLVTVDTPSNVFQDLKARAIESMGIEVTDESGNPITMESIINQELIISNQEENGEGNPT